MTRKETPPKNTGDRPANQKNRAGEEKFFKAFMKVSTPMAISTVKEGRYVDVNEAFSNIMGLPREELIEKTSTGVGYITKEQRKLVLKELTERGFVENLELEVTIKGGEKRYGLFNITKIELADQEYLLTVVTDITDRVRTENALRQSEVRYRLLVDNAEFPVVVTSLVTGKGLFINECASRFFGVPGREIDGARATDHWVRPEDRDRFVNDLMKNGRLSNYECQLKNKDGEERWALVSANIIDYAGERAVFLVYNDITERKRAEETLRQSEERFRCLVETTSDWVWEVDRQGFYTYVSPKVKDLLGYEPEEVVGRTPFDFMSADEAQRVSNVFSDIAGSRKVFEGLENVNLHKDGHQVIMETSGVPVLEESGNLAGYRGIDRDVTERKRAEAALRESEERLRNIVENAAEIIYTLSPDGTFTFVSPAWTHLLGHNISEVEGHSFVPFVHPDDVSSCIAFLAKIMSSGQPERDIAYRVKHKNGEWRWHTSVGAAIKDIQGHPIYGVGIAQDITERKKAEEEYLRLVTAIEQSAEGVYLTGPDWIIQYANPALERMIGCEAGEVIGWHARRLKSGKHDQDFYRNIRETVARGEVWSGRGVNKKKDGTFFDVEATVSPVRDKSGRIINYVCIHRDITHEVRLENQLHQAQKLEAIGTLAGGIAHDFNNLLMGIQGYTSLMLLDVDRSHPYHDKLKAIESQVKSGAYLTKQLLGFARGGRYEVKPTDLNELVRKTASMFGRTKKEIRIHDKYDVALWAVDVDPGQIEQVFLNLLVNAWQAMPAGGDLYLQTENVSLDETFVRPHEIKAGPYVKVSVTDTGFGMDEKTLQRIFDPFFTTKGMGRGIGLGLPSAYGIIKGHGGIINVYSEKGHGTTFNIYLPASKKEVVRESQLSLDLQTGHETILVVDDEEVINEVTRELLEELGYQVLVAHDGREAIETYRAIEGRIDLVILDMIMPGMGGGEVFNNLKSINPDIKAILCSGYSLNEQAKSIMARGVKAFLQKPFQIDELSQTVREVLEGREKKVKGKKRK